MSHKASRIVRFRRRTHWVCMTLTPGAFSLESGALKSSPRSRLRRGGSRARSTGGSDANRSAIQRNMNGTLHTNSFLKNKGLERAFVVSERNGDGT